MLRLRLPCHRGPRALLFSSALLGLACAPSSDDEAGSESASSSSESTDSESPTETSANATETGPSTTETETETGPSETETETGEPCTGETCSSVLLLTFNHSLPLLEGPHRLLIDTPTHDIQCGIEPELEGSKSCFGLAFADLSWTESTITVELTQPFYENAGGEPFETVNAALERAGEELWAELMVLEVSEPTQPDPCGPLCWETTSEATIVIP